MRGFRWFRALPRERPPAAFGPAWCPMVPIAALDERLESLRVALIAAHRVGVDAQREPASVSPSWATTYGGSSPRTYRIDANLWRILCTWRWLVSSSRRAEDVDPRFTLAVPDEPALLDRLVTAPAVQADPPITVGRSAPAVLALECDTWDGMLRSRVVQVLEAALGPSGSRSRVPSTSTAERAEARARQLWLAY